LRQESNHAIVLADVLDLSERMRVTPPASAEPEGADVVRQPHKAFAKNQVSGRASTGGLC
jgi:hypothetical protein